MSFLTEIFRGIRGFLTWWVIIQPWEEALRVRSIPFRQQSTTLLKPGLQWCFPFVDQVYSQGTRLRYCDLPVQTLTTADGHTVTLKGNLGYKIINIKNLYDRLQHAETALVELVTSTVAEFVYTHNRGFTPGELCTEVKDKLSFTKYGIGQVQFGITDFAYVRAIRLIQGDTYYQVGDKLKTDEVTVNGFSSY